MRERAWVMASRRGVGELVRSNPFLLLLFLAMLAVLVACAPTATEPPPTPPPSNEPQAGAGMIWHDGSLVTYHPDSESWVFVNEVTQGMVDCLHDPSCSVIPGGQGSGSVPPRSDLGAFLIEGANEPSQDKAAVMEFCDRVRGGGVIGTARGYLCRIADPESSPPMCELPSVPSVAGTQPIGVISEPEYDPGGRLLGYQFTNVGEPTTRIEFEYGDDGGLTGFAEIKGEDRTVVLRDEGVNGAGFDEIEQYLAGSPLGWASVRGPFCANEQGGISFNAGTAMHEQGGIRITSDGDSMTCAPVNDSLVCTGGRANAAVTIRVCSAEDAASSIPPRPLGALMPSLLPDPMPGVRFPGVRFGGGEGACPVGYGFNASGGCTYRPVKPVEVVDTAATATPVTPTATLPCEQYLYERDPRDGVCKPINEVSPCPVSGFVRNFMGQCVPGCDPGWGATSAFTSDGKPLRSCYVCPAGTSSKGDICYACPAGTTSESGGECKAKPVPTCDEYGYYYHPELGKCAPGAFDPAEFSTPCTEAGFVRNSWNECVPRCKDGFGATRRSVEAYTGKVLTSCYACPRGTTSSGGVCYLCPEGMTSEVGGTCHPITAPTATPVPPPPPGCTLSVTVTGSSVTYGPCSFVGKGSCPAESPSSSYDAGTDTTTCFPPTYLAAWVSGCPAGFYFDDESASCVPPSGQLGCYGGAPRDAGWEACEITSCQPGSTLVLGMGCCQADEPAEAAGETCVSFTVDMPSCGGARPGGGSGPVVCSPNDYCCLNPGAQGCP